MVLLVFWSFVIKLWVSFGFKIPLLFIFLWGIGLFNSIPMLDLGNDHAFMAYQTILSVILVIIERYKTYKSKQLF